MPMGFFEAVTVGPEGWSLQNEIKPKE